MKALTWHAGRLTPGIVTVSSTLGPVVFLGEEGRGRQYEKIGLDRKIPADIIDGRILEANPRKVSLPASSGKPAKTFYVLERPSTGGGWDQLIRINTYSSYIRGGSGRWNTIAGAPETLISGYGAFGDAGRIGSWSDGLIRMRPGDVLKVSPSRSIGGIDSFALWVDETGKLETAPWADYEQIIAVAAVEAIVAETRAGESEKTLDVAFGQMPTFTYTGRGEIRPGINVKAGVTGPAVVLGESGRGRILAQVAIVGFTPGEIVASAAVAKLSEQVIPTSSWEAKKTKVIYGLTESDRVEVGAALIRVAPPLTNRVARSVEVLRGNPVCLAAGNFAGGTAGNCEFTPDELWVLRAGESLQVRAYPNAGWTVTCGENGTLSTEPTELWQARDAVTNPAAYIAKGKAAVANVPTEWIGKVVSVHRFIQSDGRMYTEQTHEGELLAVRKDSAVLNLNWEGKAEPTETIVSGLWVNLEPWKTPVKADLGALKAKREAEESARRETARLTAERLATEEAQIAAEKAREAKAGTLSNFRVTGGEIYRSDDKFVEAWVIRPDGSLRDADQGKTWSNVEANELALRWFKNYRAATHRFEIAKLPIGGLTDAQRETVASIEQNLAKEWDGVTGMSGNTVSPPVGNGWGFGGKPAPKPTPAPSGPVAPPQKATAADMAALRAKFGLKGR